MTTAHTIADLNARAIRRMTDTIGGKGPGTEYERTALAARAFSMMLEHLAADPAIGDRERACLAHSLQALAQSVAALDLAADSAFPSADRVLIERDGDDLTLTVWDRERRLMAITFPVAIVKASGSDLIRATFPQLAPFIRS